MIGFQMLIGKKLKLGVMVPTYNLNIWAAETGGFHHPHWDCKFKANLDTHPASTKQELREWASVVSLSPGAVS